MSSKLILPTLAAALALSTAVVTAAFAQRGTPPPPAAQGRSQSARPPKTAPPIKTPTAAEHLAAQPKLATKLQPLLRAGVIS